MKIALVHDYLNEFGGAERVLEAFCEIWPDAPIYTAFVNKNSSAYKRFVGTKSFSSNKRFKGKKIITSWAQNVPFFAAFLHSPLRFLAPLIWGSFDFSNYDVVLASSSWFVTRGFKKGNPSTPLRPIRETPFEVTQGKQGKQAQGRSGSQPLVEICYCHTPPRYLYGYPTSVEWQKYWPMRIYAAIVNHYMRVYDFEASQKTDYFIANSHEVAARIRKFYRRDSKVIYPPVDVKKFTVHPSTELRASSLQLTVKKKSVNRQPTTDNYFLVVSRLVAAKKVDIVVEVCAKLGLSLAVVGDGKEMDSLKKLADRSTVNREPSTVNFLGEVSDDKLIALYQNCRAVIFPASQEDFGLVPVEAAACGKPVIVNAEGGVLESVIDASTGSAQAGQMKGKCTGVYFDPPTTGSLTLALNNFMALEKKGYFDPAFIRNHARKFSKERFKREILRFVQSKTKA